MLEESITVLFPILLALFYKNRMEIREGDKKYMFYSNIITAISLLIVSSSILVLPSIFLLILYKLYKKKGLLYIEIIYVTLVCILFLRDVYVLLILSLHNPLTIWLT
ncbi:hypothetical protein BA065_01835 [Nanoarchaeota archaeon NZ13-N]|nr:MAG: hypothetical protein BA065_01835 [Nanoarchaeota archaeon NZ13-N]